MKKLALIISLMAVIGLVMGACGDDDDGGSAKQCLEACEVAADCVYTGTEEDDWKCEGKRCVPDLCSSNDDCTASMSVWATECTDGGGPWKESTSASFIFQTKLKMSPSPSA